MIPFVIHPAAEDELFEAMVHYHSIRPALGADFDAAFDAATDRIRTHPRMYAAEADGVRTSPVDGFPYSIVYRDLGTHVWIASVSHQRRRSGHWAGRTPGDV